MAGDTDFDRVSLLEHVGRMAKSPPPRYDDSNSGYEMLDFDTSDMGTQKGASFSQRPQEYSSTWDDRDLEHVGKSGDSYNE